MKKQNLYNLTLSAVMAAISIVILLVVPRFSIFPATQWLEYDGADIPLIIAAIILPFFYSEGILVVVCFIQAFLMGGNGWVGFLMHFLATSAIIISFYVIKRLFKTNEKYILAGVVAAVLMAIVMIPISYIFYPFFGIPAAAVTDFLPFIIPFNLIKASVNSAIAIIVFYAINPAIKKILK